MERNKTIDINKRYNFPEWCIRQYNGKYLVICSETANWIVLDNEQQLDFFKSLTEHTIHDAIAISKCSKNDYVNVLIQIEAKRLEEKNVQPSFVDKLSLHFYITNVCNMKCPHCYMSAGSALSNELTTEEIFNVLEDFKKLGGIDVTFTGGEIATHKNIVEIIKFAHELGLEIKLLTNGTLWRPDMIQEVAPLISSVQFSIDGFDERSNAKVRGINAFNKTLKTVDRFVATGVKVIVAITPFFDKEFENNINNYVEFIKDLTAKYHGENFIVRVCTEMLEGREISLNEEEKVKYNELTTKIYSEYYGVDLYDYPFISKMRQRRIMENCIYGEISISANGEVFFCSRIPSVPSIGNVKDIPFEDIAKLSRIIHEKSNINNLRPCKDCELKYLCGGGCRIEYFGELTSCKDIEHLDVNDISPRKCTKEYKESFYDLMIRTNSRIFQ